MTKPTRTAHTDEQTSTPRRLERLQSSITDAGVDALLVTGAINVAYVTGYWRYYNMPAAAILEPDGRRTLIVTREEVPIAEETASADRVVSWTTRGFGLDLDLFALLASAIAAEQPITRARRLGLADGLGLAPALSGVIGAELVSAAATLERLRLTKDDDEIEQLARCYTLAWHAVEVVRAAAFDGASEIEMFSRAQAAAQIAHGEPIEFSADLLSGPNTEHDGPLRIAGTRHVKSGESVTADVRVAFDGYWSDICETIIVGDNPEISATRTSLLEILDQAAAQLRPGETGAAIYAYVADAIATRFPDASYPHHAGHAIGMTAIETPRLIPADETPFENGMVFSIEPGAYFHDRWGARVEKTYVVTPDGGLELRRDA
jgi:Xaa-Pro aminopeptidase